MNSEQKFIKELITSLSSLGVTRSHVLPSGTNHTTLDREYIYVMIPNLSKKCMNLLTVQVGEDYFSIEPDLSNSYRIREGLAKLIFEHFSKLGYKYLTRTYLNGFRYAGMTWFDISKGLMIPDEDDAKVKVISQI